MHKDAIGDNETIPGIKAFALERFTSSASHHKSTLNN